jgi:D-beta-D-heptose 7-phosphate kinase/D-beta-D-heptose 1-phosphate adenosyltransferase
MEIFNKFPAVRVLIVGDVMLDRYWWGDVNRISPEAPVPVVRLRGDSVAPGGAANVAANVAGLTAHPILIGAVGADAEAAELHSALRAKGIDPSNLVELQRRPTIVKTRVVAHSQQVVRIDRENQLELSVPEAASVIRAIDNSMVDADIILVSDYGKGLLTNEVLWHLINLGRERGKPVLIDPKGKKFKKYAGATLLTPNRREAADACSLNEESTDVINTAGRMLLEDLDLENALITQGEDGMTLFRRTDGPHHIHASAVETYDVTGAGDTVLAAVGVAHAAGLDLLNAATLSNIAAGIVIQQIGTTAIDIDKLAQALDE